MATSSVIHGDGCYSCFFRGADKMYVSYNIDAVSTEAYCMCGGKKVFAWESLCVSLNLSISEVLQLWYSRDCKGKR
jgi:TM2 domain-containing membrane protein YozV